MAPWSPPSPVCHKPMIQLTSPDVTAGNLCLFSPTRARLHLNIAVNSQKLRGGGETGKLLVNTKRDKNGLLLGSVFANNGGTEGWPTACCCDTELNSQERLLLSDRYYLHLWCKTRAWPSSWLITRKIWNINEYYINFTHRNLCFLWVIFKRSSCRWTMILWTVPAII